MACALFVDAAASKVFTCPICLNVFTDPVQFDCNDGHVFCKRCITRVPSRNGNKRCPLCRQECKDICYFHKIPFVERQIKSLLVQCPNHQITPPKARYLERKRQCMQSNMQPQSKYENDVDEDHVIGHHSNHNNSNSNSNNHNHHPPHSSNSTASSRIGQKRKRELAHPNSSKRRKTNEEELCEWIGEYSSLQTHHQQCPLQLVRCTFCNEQLLRRDQSFHVSVCPNFPVQCTRCCAKLQRRKLMEHEQYKCPSQIVACAHCGESMRRWKVRIHVDNDCKEKIVGCRRYERFGCRERFKRKHSREHEAAFVQQHLEMVTKGYLDLESRYNRLLARSAVGESESDNACSESSSSSSSGSGDEDGGEESGEDVDDGSSGDEEDDDDGGDESDSDENEDSDVDEESDEDSESDY